MIPFEDGHLGFWHTQTDGVYEQGVLWLEPDLALSARTGVLLSGADVREGYEPGVLYVSALVDHGGRILAFYGEADAHTSVAAFNRHELRHELKRSPCAPSGAVRIRFEGTRLSDALCGMPALHQFSADRCQATRR